MCWVGSKTVRRTPTPSASSRNSIGSSNHGSTTMSARHEPPDSSRELGTLEFLVLYEIIGLCGGNRPVLSRSRFRMSHMTKSLATTPIPVQLSEPEFVAFIFPHLSMPKRGAKCKLGYHRVFNLILWVLYTGMQWKCLPIPRAGDGTAMIHYTTIYKVFAKWADDGSLEQAFIASVRHLAEQHHLDLSILHGDGSNTVAKKGGDGIGYSGHKHQKGEKVLAIVENNGFVLAPLPVAPVNEADTVLLPDGLNALKRVARLTGLES